MIVSPHLDDGVLSLAGWIAAETAAGGEVVVLTVCSAGDVEYAERRGEDMAAVGTLGGRVVHLGVADAPFRGYARSFRGLVFAEVADEDSESVIAAVVTGVREVGADRVLLPLGVGEHVDHRAVHAAHTRLGGRVGFYEDRPYADVRHATRARLARLGAVVDGESVEMKEDRVEEFIVSARAAAHVCAYLPVSERACLRRLVAPASGSGLMLTSEVREVEPELRRRAARAVGAYASQVGDLFGGVEAAEAAYLATAAVRVYWRSA